MNILIVDDEPVARRIIRKFVQDDADVGSVQECDTGESAQVLMAQQGFDIVFLDIHMPGMSGLEVLGQCKGNEGPIVVFVSAYDQYALQAIEIGATDYLLKPFDEERFKRAFSRAKRRLHQEKLCRKGSELVALLSGSSTGSSTQLRGKISVHDGARIRVLEVEDIAWVEAADKHICIHTLSETVRARKTLAEMESELGSRGFLRVHRSCLVALGHVSSLGSTEGGASYLEMRNGARVTVSRSNLASLRERLRYTTNATSDQTH